MILCPDYSRRLVAVYVLDPKWDPALKALGGRRSRFLKNDSGHVEGPTSGYTFNRDKVDINQLEDRLWALVEAEEIPKIASPRRAPLVPVMPGEAPRGVSSRRPPPPKKVSSPRIPPPPPKKSLKSSRTNPK
jgi:hypothetical protein